MCEFCSIGPTSKKNVDSNHDALSEFSCFFSADAVEVAVSAAVSKAFKCHKCSSIDAIGEEDYDGT